MNYFFLNMKQMQHVTRTKQQTIQALIDSNTEFYCWFLADGSPRVGKEWLLCELYVLTRADMAVFWLQLILSLLCEALMSQVRNKWLTLRSAWTL